MTTTAKGLGHGAPVQAPHEEVLPGWRAACLAYKHEYAKGRNHTQIMDAAEEAFLKAVPNATREEASRQIVLAVHWASVNHNAWLFGRS